MSVDVIGVWVGAVLTLLVFSYLFGDTPLFRLAQAIFVGVAVGYAVIVAIYSILLPRLVVPLVSDPTGNSLLFIPLAVLSPRRVSLLEGIWFLAFGWLALVEALTGMAARWRLAIGRIGVGLLLGAVVLVQLAGIWQAYPYYLDYYNPLLGGPKKAVNVMMVGWGEGLDQAARYLNQKPNAEAMKVISWSADGCFSYFFKGSAATIDYDMGISDLRRADYVVLYLNQWQRQAPTPEFLAYFERFSPEYVVRIGGLEYARVYNMSQAPPEALPASHSSQAGAVSPVGEVQHGSQ